MALETETGLKPLVGYKMWGLECGVCGSRMSVLWVFDGHFEAWHDNTPKRCVTHFYQPPPLILREPVEKKPDARKLPRRYLNCSRCGTRFAQPKTQGAPTTEHCKSCRSQLEMFTDDEITKVAAGIPGDPT